MMSSNNNSILDGNGNGDDKEGNGNALAQKQQQQQKQQPVVSLLEKYSNLHRGIDQARKQYTERQVEIESIESEIEKIVENDRPATNEAIETAIAEKTLLLQNLSKLSANLAEAQRIEMSAKSSLELTKLKELNAIEASTSDQRKFFTACKCFRNQVRRGGKVGSPSGGHPLNSRPSVSCFLSLFCFCPRHLVCTQKSRW